MQPSVVTFVAFALLLFVAILRWQVAVPVLDATQASACPEPDAGDEKPPETDRAPRRSWPAGLAYAVAGTALVRVALLVTLRC